MKEFEPPARNSGDLHRQQGLGFMQRAGKVVSHVTGSAIPRIWKS
jgi:hypothetical protein